MCTIFDDSRDALQAISAEWNSQRPFDIRVANINGTGTGERLNYSFFFQDSVTVFYDLAKNILQGNSGRDWLFADPDDIVKGQVDNTPIRPVIIIKRRERKKRSPT